MNASTDRLSPRRPCLSVVIPAWNEAAELPETLAALVHAVEACDRAVECVVVDNASTDNTARVAAESGARVIHEPQRRISRARNAGADSARAPGLLFLDADTRVRPEHLDAVLAALDSGRAGGGAAITLDPAPTGPAAMGLRVWNHLAARFGLAAGCFVFARADLHHAIGGFDEHLYAGEELRYSRRLARAGRARGQPFGMLATPAVTSSGRKLEWFAPHHHLLVLVTFLVFPWAGRFRRLTWFWYRRPASAPPATARIRKTRGRRFW